MGKAALFTPPKELSCSKGFLNWKSPWKEATSGLHYLITSSIGQFIMTGIDLFLFR